MKYVVISVALDLPKPEIALDSLFLLSEFSKTSQPERQLQKAKRRQGDKQSPLVEITHDRDTEDYEGGRNFGHLAYRVDDIYATCERLMTGGVTINRPPRDGRMAFVKSPDGISIELYQLHESGHERIKHLSI